jgi:hypothetical protein
MDPGKKSTLPSSLRETTPSSTDMNGDVAAVRDEVGAHVVEDAVDVIRCQLVGGR